MDKVPGVVMTEARRLARNIIKEEIRRPRKGGPGGKVSDYEAKDIVKCANALLTCKEGKTIIRRARANVKRRAHRLGTLS